MTVQTPFRTTPILGPDLWQTETQFWFDTIADPNNERGPSPQLGISVTGNDGATYQWVQAGAAFSADDAVTIDTDFAATAGAGGYTAPVAVENGAYFWARQD